MHVLPGDGQHVLRQVDGRHPRPGVLPAQLDVFSTEVIPLLQRRGLFRAEYAGETLREHYGLPWPRSAFAPRGDLLKAGGRG